MWSKPKEICGYPNKGYENYAATLFGRLTAEKALSQWKGSPGHNSLIINSGKWSRTKWKGIGASLAGGEAVLWFGD